jgi:transcriptional regulator with XRE-family HTH domain
MKHGSSLLKRKQAGAWLRKLRIAAGLTQLELARRLRLRYYAFVSQVETGFARVPAEKMEHWALALGLEPAHFARQLLAYYEPELHRLLYSTATRRTGRRK